MSEFEPKLVNPNPKPKKPKDEEEIVEAVIKEPETPADANWGRAEESHR